MKSLLIAGVLLALFAWIHADRPTQAFSPASYTNEGYLDTVPMKDPKPMKKKKDSPRRSMDFKDTSSLKKPHNNSTPKKSVDTLLPK
jgi:hypothetical protein